MGTPEFAVAPLQKLIENQFIISAVVTVADKPSGRGLKLHSSPVKDFAVAHNIPVLQPIKLSDPEFLSQLKGFNADLFIVVAFRKLPESVWEMPPLGCFNLHASLLPQYRGAAPINHAIINGEEVTGVTTFFLNDEIDKGKIIQQRKIDIGPDETAGELHDRLKVIGAEVVLETVDAIFTNTYKAIDQDNVLNGPMVNEPIKVSGTNEKIDTIGVNEASDKSKVENNTQISGSLKNAPKIFRSDCKINWHQSALTIHNFIRGLSPYPGAYGEMLTNDTVKELKVIKSSLPGITSELQPGSILIKEGRFLIACQNEYIELLLIQPVGKKVMLASEFLRGNRSGISSFV